MTARLRTFEMIAVDASTKTLQLTRLECQCRVANQRKIDRSQQIVPSLEVCAAFHQGSFNPAALTVDRDAVSELCAPRFRDRCYVHKHNSLASQVWRNCAGVGDKVLLTFSVASPQRQPCLRGLPIPLTPPVSQFQSSSQTTRHARRANALRRSHGRTFLAHLSSRLGRRAPPPSATGAAQGALQRCPASHDLTYRDQKTWTSSKPVWNTMISPFRAMSRASACQSI